MNEQNSNDFCTIEQLAAEFSHLGIKVSTIRWLVRTGRLKGVRLGRRLIFRRGDLEKYISKKFSQGA